MAQRPTLTSLLPGLPAMPLRRTVHPAFGGALNLRDDGGDQDQFRLGWDGRAPPQATRREVRGWIQGLGPEASPPFEQVALERIE